MADLATLEKALRSADAAGDTAAATRFAQEIRKLQNAQTADGKSDMQPMPSAAPAGPSTAQQMADLAQGITPLGIAKTVGNAVMDPMQALQKADDGVRMLANGASFGFADKLAGYMSGTGTEAERERSGQAKERLGPVASSGLEIAGSMAPVGALMKAGVTATAIPKVPQFIGSVMDGSALGALSAYGNDADVLTGAGFGALGGAAGDVVGKVAGKVLTPKVTTTADDISKRADAAYADLDASGALYSPQAIADALNATKANLTKMGYHPKNQPGASVALDELERVAGGGLPVNTTGMQSLKETIAGGIDDGLKPNRKNNAMVMDAKKRIENLLLNPQPGQVVGGDAQLAAKAYAEGNKAYSQKMKLEKIAAALETGGDQASVAGSGGNVENRIRANLYKLKKDKGWTPDEKEALRKAYGGTLPRTIARWAGNASPMGNGLMAGLWGGLASGGGFASGGTSLIPTAIGAALTSGAKIAGQKAAKSAVKSLEDLVLVGGNKSSLPQMTPNQKAIVNALKRSLLAGGAAIPQN